MLSVVLDRMNLAGLVITADALHTQREAAKRIRGHGGEFIFLVKNNQPNLFAALDALPWSQVPPPHHHR